MSPLLSELAAQCASHALTTLSLQHYFTISRVVGGTEIGEGGRWLFGRDHFHVLWTVFYLRIVLREGPVDWFVADSITALRHTLYASKNICNLSADVNVLTRVHDNTEDILTILRQSCLNQYA